MKLNSILNLSFKKKIKVKNSIYKALNSLKKDNLNEN